MKSDLSDLDLVTEIIREKLFRRFNKELPYAFEQENVYVSAASAVGVDDSGLQC